jgi:hypothetical protein
MGRIAQVQRRSGSVRVYALISTYIETNLAFTHRNTSLTAPILGPIEVRHSSGALLPPNPRMQV